MIGRFLAFCARLILSLRYRVHIEGLENILAKGNKGVLLLPNHPAYLDPVILLAHFFQYLLR